MSSISTVIFDMGRVLVNIDFDAFPRLLGLERNRPNRVDEQAIRQMARDYETGRIGTEQFFGKLDEIFRRKYTREQLLNAWNAIIQDENSAIVPIVDAVRAKYQTAILSNTSPVHFEKSFNTTAILKKFSRSYLSFQIGAAKPDPAVYLYVIRDIAAEPSSILFIDDVSENVAAAVKSGMEGIVFKDVPSLYAELRLRQIL